MTATLTDHKEQQAPLNKAVWDNLRIRMWVISAFLLLFLATILIIAPQIQQRLDRQTKNRLAQAGVSTATLEFDWDYRNLTVSGYLPEGVSPDRLATIMRGSFEPSSALFAQGIRHLRLDLEEGLPVAVSFAEESLLVEVTTDGVDATLEGVVQSDSQRNVLVQAMLASGTDNVFDNLEVQSIADTSSVNKKIDALAALLQQTGPTQVRRSEIKLNEEELYYRVLAKDKNSAQAIESAATVEIANFNVKGGVELLSSNRLNLVAVSNGERMTLKGKVYSDSQHKRLMFAASEAVGAQNVVDNLAISEFQSDAPELVERVDGVAAVVSRFAPGITGDISLSNGELSINAETGSDSVREYLASSTARAHRAGLSLNENITVIKPEEDSVALQSALDGLIAEVRQTVIFSSGDSVLSPSAMQTLDKVALKINSYKGLVVEVEGHTDDVGRAGTNEKLSQSRANAVRDYLATSVTSNQLIAVGYGHRRPLETNDTPEGRQANRRVHFTVLKKPNGLAG